MPYKFENAKPVFLDYLGLTEETVKYVPNTGNQGIIFGKDNDKIILFITALGENHSSNKIYFDIRDSGAENLLVCKNYAESNNLKLFCLGLKHENDKFKNYVVSIEADVTSILEISGFENGRRNKPGTQINIPTALELTGNINRIKSKNFNIFFAAVKKDYLFTYFNVFDNRLFNCLKNNKSEQITEIALSTTAKECAREIIRKIYDFDKLERINSLLRMNTNIKIDSNEICSEDVLYNVFYTTGSDQFNNEKRTFMDEEYELIINGMNIVCRLTNQWCGFGEAGDAIQNSRNYLWALRDVVNIHYEGIFKIENDGANAKLICYSEPIKNKYQLNFNTNLITNESRNKIIFGAPGTGKSYELNKQAKLLVGSIKQGDEEVPNPDYYERVTFHPNYSYGQFVGTYKPVSKNNDVGENISYDFIPGSFVRILVKALKNARDEEEVKPYLLIIEEINRANVAAVFGDIFQLLDRNNEGTSEYEIETSEDLRKYLSKGTILGGKPEDYKNIKLPNNLFIWATMNSADQGVLPMDAAFKRRWEFEYIGIDDGELKEDGSKDESFEAYTIPIPKKYDTNGKKVLEYSSVNWNKIRHAINDKLKEIPGVNEDKLLGPYFLSKSVLESATKADKLEKQKQYCSLFKSKILMYLYEDVVKITPTRLFKNCGEHPRYSDVCSKFDEIGLKIFDIELNTNDTSPLKTSMEPANE